MAIMQRVIQTARGYMPMLYMLMVQGFFLGFNVFSIVALNDGMHPMVFTTYRQCFGAILSLLIALFFERNRRSPITWRVLVMTFVCSILGASMNQGMYASSLEYSNSSVSVALSNLLPAFTFLLAVFFRLEQFSLRTKAGKAKVIGTAICLSGAMVTALFEGGTILLGNKYFYWRYAGNLSGKSRSCHNPFFGALLGLGSVFSCAAWYILQKRLGNVFPAPCTSNALTCVFAALECGVVALLMGHRGKDWVLSSKIRLIGTLYAGFVFAGVSYVLSISCIERRGPVLIPSMTYVRRCVRPP